MYAAAVLEPWDPFCRDQNTRELDILRQKVDGRSRAGEAMKGDVTISPFVLPREDEFSTPQRWKAAAGPRNWNQQQGFYFYRNNRLLQAGGWSWLRAVDEHTKLLRVAVHFDGELDHAFSLNVTKMRARDPRRNQGVGQRGAVSKWAKAARERYDRRPSVPSGNGVGASAPKSAPAPKEPSKKADAPPNLNIGKLSLSLTNVPTETLAVARGSQPGTVRIMVPQNHELAVAFNGKGSPSDRELKRLCAAALAVLESVHERRMKPDDIPDRFVETRAETSAMKTFSEYLAIVDFLIKHQGKDVETALREAQVPVHLAEQIRSYLAGPVDIARADLILKQQALELCQPLPDDHPQPYTSGFLKYLLDHRGWNRTVVETLEATSLDLVCRIPKPDAAP